MFEGVRDRARTRATKYTYIGVWVRVLASVYNKVQNTGAIGGGGVPLQLRHTYLQTAFRVLTRERWPRPEPQKSGPSA